MAPFWPFKRGSREPEQVEDEAPPTLTYKKGQPVSHRTSVPHHDASAYTEALALFGDGSATVEAAGDQSLRYDGAGDPLEVDSASPETEDDASSPNEALATQIGELNETEHTWVHHTDGYHYKQLPDGSFDPMAHTVNNEGVYVPYG